LLGYLLITSGRVLDSSYVRPALAHATRP
jgi:hypothetical protein